MKMRPLQGSVGCTLLFDIIREERRKHGLLVGFFSWVICPWAIRGSGFRRGGTGLAAAVDTEFVIYAVGVFGYAFRQYVHFLRYFRAAKALHDTVRYLIFTAG
jgi:hypothetical protein